MGASVPQILILLTSSFTRLVLIAFILAIPLAWFGMDAWLSNFAFRGQLQIMSFVIGGVLALLIAWITVISQTLKAAMTNPVDSIRYE
jgi:putative ABC transport system permease protein